MQEALNKYKALSIKSRTELALSEHIPLDMRPFLREDQWSVVRCYFARRADLSKEEVSCLINDDDHVIRLCIAKRNDLTPEMVEKCVNDPDPNVRHAISRSTLLSKLQSQQLCQDIDELVRLAAAKGPRAVQYRQRPGQARLIK